MTLARIRDLWRSLEPRGQLTIVASGLIVLVTFYFLYSYASQPSYATLVTGVDPAQTGQMTTALASAGISYRVGNGGTEIDVPDSQTSQARIALASKGLTNGGQVGYEIFNNVSMGATDFQQKIDYQRALEGEIDRAIQKINGITSADVQLVLPADTLFVDQSSKASAAVLLTAAAPLDPSTVAGIAHLVAAAVKGLSTGMVTITDQSGSLLWPSVGSSGTTASTKLAAEQLYAAQLAASINAMLDSTLGAGKAQARVHADLNVDQTTINHVIYAKKGTPLQSQTSQENLKSTGGAPVLPAGTATNTTTTPSYAAGASNSSTSNYTNKSTTTSYGVNKTIQRTKVAPGSVNRLDVALLVDSSVPAKTVASLKQSVASLAGIDAKRGDTLAVSRLAFAKPAATTTAKPSPLAGVLGNPIGMVKYVALALAMLVFLVIVRRGLKRREGEGVGAEPTWLREIERSVAVAELEAGPTRNALDPATARRAALKAEAEDIASKQPEQIAAQVSEWLKE
ncbi:MAG TPA: flagellar basal-body MS-ring/collar protein FliF [Gaiellaceae bacterium]|nr:flagellar basal-body MS-ring/collar protein FliF [Gaiellaceae bacterium]